MDFRRDLKRAYDGAPSIYNPRRRVKIPTRRAINNSTLVSGYRRNHTINSSRGYRSKWYTANTRTNPVYPRPEVKWADTTFGTIAVPITIPASGSVFVLNSLAQGITSQTRIGSQVATKSVYYQIVFNVGGTPLPNAMRHMLVWDRQHNGGSPVLTATDILAGPGTTPLLTAPLNLSNRDRFVVLADDRFTLSPNGDQIRYVDEFRKINQLTTYPLETAADNDPVTGALCLLMISDETATANQPTFYGTWRVRYMDN